MCSCMMAAKGKISWTVKPYFTKVSVSAIPLSREMKRFSSNDQTYPSQEINNTQRKMANGQ